MTSYFQRLRDFFTPVASDLDFWEQIAQRQDNGDLFRLGLIAGALLAVGLLALIFYRGAPASVVGKRTGFLKRLGVLLGAGVLLGVVAWFQTGEMLDKKKRGFQLMEDTLYLPSAKTVKTVAMGYDEALSSFLFLRAIQAYGGGWQFTGKGGRPKLFEHYFDVITDLDPKFTRAYTFGNMMVGEEMRRGPNDLAAPAAGLALMVKGLHFHPENHEIPYNAAFFAQDRLKDYERAIKYYRVAIQPQRNAPAWMERMLVYFAVKAGQFKGSIGFYLRLYLRSLQEKSLLEEDIARSRLTITQEEWGAKLIGDAIEEYRAQNGEYPASLGGLLDTKALASYDFCAVERLFPPDQPRLLDVEARFAQALQDFVRTRGTLPPDLRPLLLHPAVATRPFAGFSEMFPQSGYSTPLLDTLRAALEEFREKTGSYPQALGQLAATEAAARHDASKPGQVVPLEFQSEPLAGNAAFLDPSRKLADQFERFQEAISVHYERRVPPASDYMRYPDRHGWNYRLLGERELWRGEGKPYELKPRREDEAAQISAELRQRIADIKGRYGMPAPDVPALRAWLARSTREAAPELPRDPRGTLFLYNPVTGEGDYASSYIEGYQ